jgi:DNA-binding beta-propeller fold protein YncE
MILAFMLFHAVDGEILMPAHAAATAEQVPGPVWPKPPAPVRIRFLKSVATPTDWGVSQSFFRHLLDALTGNKDLHLVRPTGVVERDGMLYVADPGALSLFLFDARQNNAFRVSRIGEETLVSPVALALGPADTLFLADSRLKKVYALDRQGQLRQVVAQQGLQRPAALAYDAVSERLYVADSMAHHVLVYALDGRLLQTIGRNGRANGEFNSPTHLAVTGNGTLLVTDALNFRVQAFDREGRFLWKFGKVGDGAGDFAAPKGVAADSAGEVLVVDALFDAVQIFNQNGTLLLGFGEHGVRPGQFWLPGGLFVDPQDTVYVADAYNQRIQVFQRVAVPTEVAQ